jgi:hypothetical protein
MIPEFFAFEGYRAGICPNHTKQHLHQCRFARTVLPQKADNATTRHRQVNVTIGTYRTVPLADAAHFERRRHVGDQRDWASYVTLRHRARRPGLPKLSARQSRIFS